MLPIASLGGRDRRGPKVPSSEGIGSLGKLGAAVHRGAMSEQWVAPKERAANSNVILEDTGRIPAERHGVAANRAWAASARRPPWRPAAARERGA